MTDFFDDLEPRRSRAAPVAQLDIEAEILRFSRMLEERTDEIVTSARESAMADVAYKHRHTLALLAVEGRNSEEREARAHQQVLGEYETRKIKEAVLLGAQESARNLRQQLSSLQTLAANQRAMVS